MIEKCSKAILIAGPTASGKSAFAIRLALQHDGVIINADSMQVYKQLHIITARPNVIDLDRCPHRLYGHRDAGEAYSVALWLDDVRPVLEEVRDQGRVPIFVGGTGLYFKGLIEGLSPVPQLDPGIRRKWRELAKTANRTEGGTAGGRLHDELTLRDPIAAAQLRPSDHQRLIRALEVIDSTGKSIVEWHNKDKGSALLWGNDIKKILLMPQRPVLHARINERFDRMVGEGALGEVAKLLELAIEPSLPAMKAIGVPQLSNYLTGECSLEEAIRKAKAATRQFAKRQSTWFNNQFSDDWQRQ